MFESLTLIQTEKIAPMPVVLIGASFWSRAIDFGFLVREGMIDADDTKLFQIVDTADAAIDVLAAFYGSVPPE